MRYYTSGEVLNQWGEQVFAEVKAAIPKATGKTAESTLLETTELKVEITTPKYIGALIDGRGPTRSGRGSGPTLQQRIMEWMGARSIHATIRGSQSQSKADLSLSWAISKSIHRKGTKLFQDGGGRNLFASIITPSRIGALTRGIAIKEGEAIQLQLIKQLEA